MKRFAAALLALLASGEAEAEDLVVALSTSDVRISSNFTGATITVFGAIERDAQTVSRADAYDVVVVLRGPTETAVIRRKDRVLGLWINRRSERLRAPSFYAVHSSRPLDDIADPALQQRLGIGAENLLQPIAGTPEGEQAAFRDAFLRLKTDGGLYAVDADGVTFPGTSIFIAAVPLPANVPVGAYDASVLLFRSGALLAEAEERVIVQKAGVEQVLFDASRELPLVYALTILAAAGFVGWLAGVIFRRD